VTHELVKDAEPIWFKMNAIWQRMLQFITVRRVGQCFNWC